MNINPFIQTAFGAIVGGFVVIATNWLTSRAEKKRQSQEWWEQKYITEGIDCLIAYLKSIQIYGISMNLAIGTNPPMIAKPQEVPLEALARIEAFLYMDISSIIIFAYLASGSKIDEQKEEALVAITKVLDILYQLRREILRHMPEISSRYHHVNVARQYEQVKTGLSEYLDKVYAELVEGIMHAAEAYEDGMDTDEKALLETESEEKEHVHQ